jgi:hypothetical protein
MTEPLLAIGPYDAELVAERLVVLQRPFQDRLDPFAIFGMDRGDVSFEIGLE